MALVKSRNFSHEYLRDGVTHISQIKVIDLFTFSRGSNWNKQGGHVTLMWLAALSVQFQHFHVAT